MNVAPKTSGVYKAASSGSATRTSSSGIRLSGRFIYFAMAVFVFIVATAAAFVQEPRPDASQAPARFSKAWWIYPVERDAEQRLPIIDSYLQSVFVAPGTNKVWAVGTKGTIVHSNDGGRTWAQQNLPVDLETAAPPESQDAKSKQKSSQSSSLFFEAHAAQTKEIEQKNLQQQPNIENNGKATLRGTRPSPNQNEKATERPQIQNQVQQFDTNTQDEPARLPQQIDGGRESRGNADEIPGANGQQTPSATDVQNLNKTSRSKNAVLTKPDLYSVYFVDGDRGWVVGDRGTILATENGGVTWAIKKSGFQGAHTSVQFLADGKRGWIAVDDGEHAPILITADGGNTWEVLQGVYGWSSRVQFLADGKRGWNMDQGRYSIFSTENSGKSWLQLQIRNSGRYKSFQLLADGKRGWVTGERGIILFTDDGGETWTLQRSDIGTTLEFVHFLPDGSQGWAVGENGLILTTRNEGLTWERQQNEGEGAPALSSIHFSETGKQGWVVGKRGTILSTNDGGDTWIAQTRSAKPVTTAQSDSIRAENASASLFRINEQTSETYGRWPAPWYYLSLLFVAGFLTRSAVVRDVIVQAQPTIADALASDRPLEAGEHDALKLGSIALGLSRFLRNENTQPPLTLAITGEWGTGKSSLMNLLKADLQRYGFRPVWFNAWHYQKEEHLLASLLENIRTQAIPSWLSWAGIVFRARLIWARVLRRPVFSSLVAALFIWAVGYFLSDPARVLQAWTLLTELPKHFVSEGKEPTAPASTFPAISVLLGFITALVTLFRAVKPFGISPASLLSSMSNRASARDLNAQCGFRHHFAREFKQVTRALNPRTMLILIDDLDRCRPENVLEVLEAINFLVVSGDCFVVIGMARDRVERAIGLGFKDVAKEMIDSAGQNSEEDEDKRRRAEFARHYLEKLVNIEVPVPVATAEQSGELLKSASSGGNGERDQWKSFGTYARRGAVAALFVVLAVSIFVWGWQRPIATETKSDVGVASSAPDRGSENSATPAPPGSIKNENDDTGTGQFIPGQYAEIPKWLVIPPLIALLLVGILLTRRRSEVVIKDSPEFAAALEIWHPLIYARQNTPRSIKRYMNRVRYFAMRTRPAPEEDSVWQRIVSWLRRLIGKNDVLQEGETDGDLLPEPTLVALSAIQHAGLHDEEAFASGGWVKAQEKNFSEVSKALPDAVTLHKNRFGEWPPTAGQRSQFQQLSAGIRVH